MARTTCDKVGTLYRRFNDWLRGELKARKMSQKDLAVMLGMDPGTVSRKMARVNEWSFKDVLEILDQFETTFDEIGI